MDCLRFSVDGQRYAVELAFVKKVLPAAWISPLGDCPLSVIGVVNYQSKPLPVIDLRRKLNLSVKELCLSDRFIWMDVAGWDLVVVADDVEGVEHLESHLMMDSAELPAAPSILKGIVAQPDGLLLIQNPARLLELKEREELQDALTHIKS